MLYRSQEGLLEVINFFFWEVTGLITFGKNKMNNSSKQTEIEKSLLAEINNWKTCNSEYMFTDTSELEDSLGPYISFVYIFVFYKNKKCLWT